MTPILLVPLDENAYFVSHGNKAFPDLMIVLKGYGVTVHLVGSTQIKNGVTTSTFRRHRTSLHHVRTYAAAGPYSALTANADFCSATLVIPTESTAQNGVVPKRSTTIRVTGRKAKPMRAQQLAKAPKRRRKGVIARSATGRSLLRRMEARTAP